MSQRKIIVHMATSADGFIARPDGDVEWLNRRPNTVDYGTKAFYDTIDTILWGRKTYDWAVAYHEKNKTGAKIFDPKIANYIFSRGEPKTVQDAEFVSEPVKTFAERLRSQPGKNIWMMGGGDLTASFLDAGEIDELDFHVMPVLIGEGIPMIAPRHRDLELNLLLSQSFPDGVLRLRYKVPR